jgi:SAM-dependent methyltransferase
MPSFIPVLILLFVAWFAYTVISTLWVSAHGAPWVPTKLRTVRRMLDMARVQAGETVYDLGSGDGRVLFVAAREFGARAVGIELDPLRVLWTRGVACLLGVRNRVEVRRGDFFTQDFRDADVVVCYLLTSTNRRLADKLLDELRPGVRVVSNAFPFPDWELGAEDLEHRVYLYRMP